MLRHFASAISFVHLYIHTLDGRVRPHAIGWCVSYIQAACPALVPALRLSLSLAVAAAFFEFDWIHKATVGRALVFISPFSTHPNAFYALRLFDAPLSSYHLLLPTLLSDYILYRDRAGPYARRDLKAFHHGETSC